ncbi:MAG: glycoside hydrolase family 3 C-terminal domain-containing protein [Bacteroidaceae bacterium]|nr:glycoside hydrolase family 3 C-terminal domain-containing protein [Bacteroidaceae bacterium]
MNFRTRISIVFMSLLTASASAQVYLNPNASASERAADLVSRLTLEEKVQLMQDVSEAVPRLGIRRYNWWNEALHGHARDGLATVFPQAIGLAATWNDGLVNSVFNAVSDEARAKFHDARRDGHCNRYEGLTFWTPNINIFRDPRWGRGQETYGEDPYLTTQMGLACVRGLQGPSGHKYDKLHACAKHFAVHSGPEGTRHTFNVENLEPRYLWETYLPAFKALVQKGDVREVMCAYNRYDGAPCCGSEQLLHQILRNEWGYKHLVVSDCGAVTDFWNKKAHETEPDAKHASATAVISGTDLECGSNYKNLPAAVRDGLISEERINTSLKRLLEARFRLGEMDDDALVEWSAIPMSVVSSKAHRDIALRAARESMVLLKNDNGALPLDKSRVRSIAVVGPNAADSVMMWGNYNGTPAHTVTVLEGLRNALKGVDVKYVRGCDGVNTTALDSRFGCCSYNGKQGFHATYWNNRRQEGEPVAEAQVTTPFHYTTEGATVFAPGVGLTDFSARYEGVFKAEATEDIDLQFNMHCYYSLIVNGDTVSKGKSNYNMMHTLYKLHAEAGKSYNIVLNFEWYYGYAQLDFDMGRLVPINFDNVVSEIRDCDAVVMVGGINANLEGEEMSVKVEGFNRGDRVEIGLPRVQTDLVRKIYDATGKKPVFVNCSGSAVSFESVEPYCDAIVQAWYGGEQGGRAVADVLTGEYNPAGRLPVTFYKSASQLPPFDDYSMKGRTYRYFTGEAEYPFGYGLSYSSFRYGKAKVASKFRFRTDADSLTVLVPVTNTSAVDGDEVVQLYIRKVAEGENAPLRSLRAFRRVPVAAHSTMRVALELPREAFEFFDCSTNTMRCTDGQYELLYGSSSDLKDLKSTFVKVRF